MKAIWNHQTIAESNETINIEGNQYFPATSINKEFFRKSSTQTFCHWKGKASYYDIVVEGQTNSDAAWYYPKPSSQADNIKNYVAFWRGVEIKL